MVVNQDTCQLRYKSWILSAPFVYKQFHPSGRFLKDESKVLATPIPQICNLSIKLSMGPGECKIAKLKPLYKKGKKTDPKNYRPISSLPVIYFQNP